MNAASSIAPYHNYFIKVEAGGVIATLLPYAVATIEAAQTKANQHYDKNPETERYTIYRILNDGEIIVVLRAKVPEKPQLAWTTK